MAESKRAPRVVIVGGGYAHEPILDSNSMLKTPPIIVAWLVLLLVLR